MYAVYEETSTGVLVTALYHNPVPEQTAGNNGVYLEGTVPQPDQISGLIPVLKIDVEKGQLYYDYERPDTLESRIGDLQKENTELKIALAELATMVAGGAK